MADKSVVKNSKDDNSICSDDEELNTESVNSIQNILSNIQKIQKNKNKKTKKKDEIVIKEDDDDKDDDDEDVDVSDSSDTLSEDDDDDDDDVDEDEDDEDEDEDGDEDDIFDSIGVTNEALGAMFQGVFIDNEGNTIADSLSKIAEELHKLNHNMKKTYNKKK